MKVKGFLIAAALCVTSACAQKPETIERAYISPATYSNYNCTQLSQEAVRIDGALSRAYAQQNKARRNDTWGVVLVGVPVSSLSGGNVSDQIADLKGQKYTLEQTQIQRSCL